MSICGSRLSANPRCAVRAETAQTENAAFIVCPRRSISFIIASAGVMLTKPTRLESFMPSLRPRRISGFDIARRSSSAAGRLPSITTPMEETVFIASSICARFGVTRISAMYCTAPAVRPSMDSQRSSVANAEKARIDCFAKSFSPSISSMENSVAGSV